MLLKKLKEKHDAMANTKLPPAEVAKLLKKGAVLVDVRSRLEAKIGLASGAINIPLLRLKGHLKELPCDRTIVTYCGTGGRAAKAVEILEANGFKAANGGGYKAIRKILEDVQQWAAPEFLEQAAKELIGEKWKKATGEKLPEASELQASTRRLG